MNKLPLGLWVGGVLGLFDGLSAIFSPEAREMIGLIVVAATIKGLLTGAAVGALARRYAGLAAGLSIGAIVGGFFSLLAAIPTGTYVTIMGPGILVGILTGLIVAKWGH